MSILEILYYPDPRLKIIAKPIFKINKQIKKIAFDMIDTMHHKEGIGLAATQVNIPLKLIVINTTKNFNNNLVLINPKIIEQSGNMNIEEGCLSIPNYTDFVKRANYIKIQALDLNNNTIEIEADSILSVCIQHEIDHLNGKLFIDYLSNFKKNRLEKKIKKYQNKYFI